MALMDNAMATAVAGANRATRILRIRILQQIDKLCFAEYRSRMRSCQFFSRAKPIIGVIHVGALPGTPHASHSVAELVDQAKQEAQIYRDAGVDGVIVENMHDVPYLRGEVGPEIVAAMTAIGLEVKKETSLPVGIQI